MSKNRVQQLMQSALDGDLDERAQAELNRIMDDDPSQVAEYDAQKQVDDLLRLPPMERAPGRLGVAIMARIGQVLADQQRRKGMSSELSEAQLRVAVQLVTVTTLPLLAGAGYLLLNAHSNPQAIERLLAPALALLVMVIDAMTIMLEQAEALYEDDPQLALALLTLIPSTLLLMAQEILQGAENGQL
ncbi:MAG: hypothetical protein EA396_10855 [Anaerolineaceae bacterium]|nr:MAG: hypothetical protein EA396_10855 [Anaerolineaceae bacterium]